MNRQQTALSLIAALNNAGHSAYMVGGCVRDMCLQKEPDDFDIATSALPAEVKLIFPKTVDTGLRHGTVTVIQDGIPFEVTTYRTESAYEQHRRPQQVRFVSDITADLKRRDFTINAMAYHPRTGIVDPFCGQNDLQKKCIRCVGHAATRFEEDALRILRGMRFACKFNFEIEPHTRQAMQDKKELLRYISAERIYAELTKCLLSPFPHQLRLGYDLGIFSIILPELAACFATAQNTKYHIYSVGDHILHTVNACPADKTIRFAALLHDIAKPICKTTDAHGQDHFHGHEQKSADMAACILQRLKAEKKLIVSVQSLIAAHRFQLNASNASIKKQIAALGKPLFPKLLALMAADTAAHNPAYMAQRAEGVAQMRAVFNKVNANNEPISVSELALSGKDLKEMGFSGREIGQTLQALLDYVLQYPQYNTKERLKERVLL